MAAQIEIANIESFLASVRRAQAAVGDLSVPLRQIGLDWMRSNQTIFALGGPGPWVDLSGGRSGRDPKTGRYRSPNSGYKAAKLRRWGFVYPIGKASGALERSITVPGDANSLFEVMNGQALILGTRVVSKTGANYPAFLRDGTRTMPARNLFQIPDLSVKRWELILETFLVGRLRADQPTIATGT